MSKHNYSQYSNKNNRGGDSGVAANAAVKQNHQHKRPEKVVEPAAVKMEETPVVRLVQESVETVKLPDTVTGTVVNCTKLNVRENCTVDSGIVCILNAMSEIEIDVKKSTDDWFYITTAIGAEGYCMKQYVEAHM